MFFLSFVFKRVGVGGGVRESPICVVALPVVYILVLFIGRCLCLVFLFGGGGGGDLREPLICVVALPYNIYLFSVLWRQVFLLLSIFRPSLSYHLLL